MRQTLGVISLLIEAAVIFAAFRYDQDSAHTWLIALGGWGAWMATAIAFVGLPPYGKEKSYMSSQETGIESLIVEPGDFCHEPNFDISGAPNGSVFTSVCSITSISVSSGSSVTGVLHPVHPHDAALYRPRPVCAVCNRPVDEFEQSEGVNFPTLLFVATCHGESWQEVIYKSALANDPDAVVKLLNRPWFVKEKPSVIPPISPMLDKPKRQIDLE
jgi:hypothetical protein